MHKLMNFIQKFSDFFKEENIKNKEEQIKKYSFYLIIIGFFLAIFYYFYIRYYNRFYFVHYFEYYLRSIELTQLLQTLNFSDFLHSFFLSYVDKLVYIRTIPFFLIFGVSHFNFFYFNFLFNYVLLFIFYKTMLKVFPPKKSFLIIILIITSYFFLELSASFYVDLTYFILCSMFFIFLSLFDRNYRKYNNILVILIAFLFFTKNFTYVLLAILSPCILFWFFLTKEKKFRYVFHFLIILFVGCFVYLIFGLGLHQDYFFKEMSSSGLFITPYSFHSSSLIQFFRDSLNVIFNLRPRLSFFSLLKFRFILLDLLIYPAALIVWFKKKNKFWPFLFIVSETVLFFFFNIKQHFHALRFFLPFYFIYFVLFYDLLTIIIENLKVKWKKIFLVSIILLLALGILFNIYSLFKMHVSYSVLPKAEDFNEVYTDLFYSELIEPYSYIFIEMSPLGHQPFILFNSEQDFYDTSFQDRILLLNYDSRFKYFVTDNETQADYFLCTNCSKYILENSVLIKVYMNNTVAFYAIKRGDLFLYMRKTSL